MNLLYSVILFVFIKKYTPLTNASSKEFRPKVVSICSANGFNISLETTRPFFGTIHPVNRTGCRINGIGKNRTNYSIPFSSGDFCNVRYNSSTNTYTVKIEINEHPVLVLQRDRTFEFSCENRQHTFPNATSEATLSSIQKKRILQPTIDFYDGMKKVTDVIYGNSYRIRITLPSQKYITADNFRITKCFVSDGLNVSVQIIDGFGCSINCDLIEEFRYQENFIAEASISSMFRFPKSSKLETTCSILRGPTIVPQCQKRCVDQADTFGHNVYNNETDLIDDIIQIRKINPASDVEEETVKCVVNVITADRVLMSAASDALVPEVTCSPNAEFSMLRNYCIILCAAFMTGCSINVVFCCLYLMRRNVKCSCGTRNIKTKKKSDEPQLNCDFWIKEKTLPRSIVDDFDSGDWSEKPLQKPISVKSYATVRQKLPHPHANLSQLPLRIPQGVAESPSLKSTDSSQTSTFGIRQIMPASYTIDTDLNSLHSSISTEKNGGYFLKNGDFSTPYNLQAQCLTNISNNSKEAYSIL